MTNPHVKDLMEKAESGDVEAQFDLGCAYTTEVGVPKHLKQSLYWYCLAAEQGHITAQRIVGGLYLSGTGTPKNYALAAYWYGKAAAQGNAVAQYHLGFAYENGQGVPKDYTQAVIWYRKAAEQGDADAQYALAALYSTYGNNCGVKQNFIVAYALCNIAGQILKKAKNSLGYSETQMSPKDVDIAQALSFEMIKPGNLLAALDAYLVKTKKEDQNA